MLKPYIERVAVCPCRVNPMAMLPVTQAYARVSKADGDAQNLETSTDSSVGEV